MKKTVLYIAATIAMSPVLLAQNVGIGTTQPKARLHVTDSSVVFSANTDAPLTPGNPPVSGYGRRMMWYADKAAFRAGFSVGDFWDKDSTGNYSVAFGDRTRASGQSAVAMGSITSASGTSATAFGVATIASNNYATALGNRTVASGINATSMGYYTNAPSYIETAIGLYTEPYTHTYSNFWAGTDRLFSIGNGQSETQRSNALTILKNGNTGLGTTTPKARLHVNEGSVVFSGEGESQFPATFTPLAVSGGGRRMVWYADKSAFRVGWVYSKWWDTDSIGRFSIAMGGNSIAKATSSVAIGSNNEARGDNSVAIGALNIALGTQSTALGALTTASGYNSTAMGYKTVAPSAFETVIGVFNKTYTPNSTNFFNANDRLFTIGNGEENEFTSNAMVVLKSGNTGIGADNPTLAGLVVNKKAGAVNAMFGGNTSGVAIESQSPGIAYNCYYNGSRKAISPGYASLTGQDPNGGRFYIMTTPTSSASAGTFADLQERIGILPNGNVIIGGGTPDQKLSVNGNASKTGGGMWAAFSDARVKQNVTNYTPGLAEILAIRPVSFQYNSLSGYADVNTRFVGVIAQEIEKILPSTVTKTNTNPAVQDLRSFNGSELTYTLVNAIKEQQQQIEQARKENATLIKRLEALEAVLLLKTGADKK